MIKQYLKDFLYSHEIDVQYKRFIDRYIRLVEHLQTITLDPSLGVETHHIVPRSWNKNLTNDPNNLIRVSSKAHVVLHHILALTRDGYMTRAFLLQTSSKSIKQFNYAISARLISQAKLLSFRPVINLNTKEEFPTVADAMRFKGLSISQTRRIRDRIRISGDFYQYKDVVDLTSIEEELRLYEQLEYEKIYNKIIVDLNTGIEYPSIAEASRSLGIPTPSSISTAIRNMIKAKDHYFQYKRVTDQTSVEYELQLCLDQHDERMKDKRRAIINLNTGERFKSIQEAQRALGLSSFTSPEKRIKNGGYYFQYEDVVKATSIEYQLQLCEQAYKKCRKVVNLNTGEQYDSVKQAMLVNQGVGLCAAIKNRTRFAGFFW